MIEREIDSIADVLDHLGDYDRVWRQHVPEKYNSNELAIRFLRDSSFDETGIHYRVERDYQIIYFGESELDCIRAASNMQSVFNSFKAIPLSDVVGNLFIESFSYSSPTMSSEDDVYFILGILSISASYKKDLGLQDGDSEYGKIENIEIGITETD